MNVYLVTEATKSPFSSPLQNAPRLESLLHPFSDWENCEIGDGRTGGRSWNNPHRYKTSSRRLKKNQKTNMVNTRPLTAVTTHNYA